MLNKRGQVTIFVVVAIIIIAIVALIYFSNQDKVSQDPFTPETESIYEDIYSCIEFTAKNAIYSIGQTGGYYLPSLISNQDGIAYYYYEGENFMPSKEELSYEISQVIDNTLKLCTEEKLNVTHINITSGKIESSIEIWDYKMIVNVEYPITITKEDSSSVLKNWEDIEIETTLGKIHSSIEQIILGQLNNENICLTCISNIAEENSLIISITSIEEDVLFSVLDEKFGLDGFSYEFMFVNKY